MISALQLFLAVTSLFSFIVSTAEAATVVGRLYPVEEKDAVQELRERAASVNWDSLKAQARKRISQYHPHDRHPLAHTKEPRTYTVSLVNTLSFDVTDAEGNIMYPSGYSYNPLDYVPLPYDIYVIDGSDNVQVNWVRKKIESNITARVFIVDGVIPKVMERLNRRVYYAGKNVIDKFQIESVPSIIRQDGNVLLIEQVRVRDEL